jgi:hypothetical protein
MYSQIQLDRLAELPTAGEGDRCVTVAAGDRRRGAASGGLMARHPAVRDGGPTAHCQALHKMNPAATPFHGGPLAVAASSITGLRRPIVSPSSLRPRPRGASGMEIANFSVFPLGIMRERPYDGGLSFSAKMQIDAEGGV